MTIIITDGNGTDVHAYDEEHLFVSHPYHDAKVARYIERVRSDLESENETEVLPIRSVVIVTFDPSIHHGTRSRTAPRYLAEGRMTALLEPSTTKGKPS
jgi:hypothetical protein